MTRLRILVARILALLSGKRLDRDLQDQIASHLEEAIDEYLDQGHSPVEARREALRDFGSIGATEEGWRDAQRLLSVEHLRRDLRHAVRSLRRRPGFAIIVVTVLGLATGAATLVFALLNAIVLQSLPYPQSDRLVVVRTSAPGRGVQDGGLSVGLYHEYAEHSQTLESLALYRERALMNLRLPGEGTERVQVTYASAALFKVFQVEPALGRLFTDEDGRQGFMDMTREIPILLSHQFWVRRFGAAPNVIGRVLTVNNNPREVVGVLPETFAFPRADVEIWMLVEPAPSLGNARPVSGFAGNLGWEAVARLRPDVTPAATRAELAGLVHGLELMYPDEANARITPRVTPLKTFVVHDVAEAIWLLFGGIVLLLIVAGANAGSLFLVRAEHRTHEVAVRRALGADGTSVARLFVIEALVLTGAAAIAGVALARVLLPALIAFAPMDLPRAGDVRIDGSAMAFAAILAIVMALLYGLLPLPRRQQTLAAGLTGEGPWATAHRRGRGRLDRLIVLQVALALTLMVGSALMVKTYRNLSRRDLGFSPNQLLVVEVGLPSRRYREFPRIYHDLVDRVRRIANVRDASVANFVPLTAGEYAFPVEGAAKPVLFKFFVPGYFQSMGTPILEGAPFGWGEPIVGSTAVLVSNTLARRLYPAGDAVGHSVRRLNPDGTMVSMAGAPVRPLTIAGVVADVREVTLRDSPSEIVYIPLIDPPVELSIVPTDWMLVVRSRTPPLALAPAVRRAVAEVDPDLSVGRVQTMDEIVSAARGRETFVGVLLLAAAAMSLLLGALGVYGSVAQVTRRRSREIAIRVALGASGSDVARMVTAGSLRAVMLGGGLGILASLVTSGWLGSLLFGVGPRDPMIFLTVTAGLIATAGVASWLAARQAVGLPAITALRED